MSGKSAFVQPSNEHSAPQLHEDYTDVILILLPKYDKEYIPKVKVMTRQNGDIDLYQLLEYLKKMGFPIEGNIVSYYSYMSDMYVYCGNDPIPPTCFIPASEVATTGEAKQITIRVRQVNVTVPTPAAAEQTPADVEKEKLKIENPAGPVSLSDDEPAPKQKRTKERKIGEILNKVLLWRKYYSGMIDPTTGQVTKLSLEDAAQKVGISKKSLDDYLLQIRFGKKYGFNFNDHYHDRVGVLRSFVKKHKNKKADKVEDDNFDFPTEFESLIQKKDKYGNEVKIEAPPSVKKPKI